jgi:hypothetical protein
MILERVKLLFSVRPTKKTVVDCHPIDMDNSIFLMAHKFQLKEGILACIATEVNKLFV